MKGAVVMDETSQIFIRWNLFEAALSEIQTFVISRHNAQSTPAPENVWTFIIIVLSCN
jgi:hypothetical protein